MELQDFINKIVQTANEETIREYPLHIRRAFAWVGVYEDPYRYHEQPGGIPETDRKDPWHLARDNIQRFVQRWGGVDEAALLRALQEDTGVDRIKAIFAIGYSPFPHALDIIAPYLSSPNRIERCAAACVMGVQLDERAIEGLKEFFLHDDLDAAGKMITEAEYWYQNYYAILALILAYWGPPEMTEILRQTLLRISAPDHPQTIAYHGDDFTPTHLFYALGRRGYFAILDEVQLSPRGHAMALFSLAAGYLNIYERSDALYWAIERDETLRQTIVQVWKDHLNLSAQDIQQCFAIFHELRMFLFSIAWWRKYE